MACHCFGSGWCWCCAPIHFGVSWTCDGGHVTIGAVVVVVVIMVMITVSRRCENRK